MCVAGRFVLVNLTQVLTFERTKILRAWSALKLLEPRSFVALENIIVDLGIVLPVQRRIAIVLKIKKFLVDN